MSNLRICAKNLVDDPRVTLSTTAAVEYLPLANLQNTRRSKIMRVDASPAFEIKGTLSVGAVYASMCALLRSNLQLDAQWRFQGYSDNAWTTQVVDTGLVDAIPAIPLGSIDFGITPLGADIFDSYMGQKSSILWFARTAIASWKITISDTGNTNGVIDACRLWVADYLELGTNPKWGLKNGWKESTTQWETEGGSLFTDAGAPRRVLAFDLENISEADRASWMQILRYAGMRTDVFVALYPDGTDEQVRDYSLAGFITAMPDLTALSQGRDGTNVTIKEF